VVAGPEVLITFVLFSGIAGTGKSSLADTIARDIGAPAFSFDWVMGALTPFEGVQAAIQGNRELFRAVGYSLLTNLSEKQLRNEQSAILDCVTRQELLTRWQHLGRRYGQELRVVECICPDASVHRERIEGRVRGIPGWAELKWEYVAEAHRTFEPLEADKLVVDATEPFADNLARVRAYLGVPS
jgi:predicted kinase